jgi:hypothetical protein
MRCEICGEGESTDGLPDWACWDATASPSDVHEWAGRVARSPRDPALAFLRGIGSPEAAEALRSYVRSDSPTVVRAVVESLGWSGDASDGPALLELIDHEVEAIRIGAAVSLAELEIEDAIEPLAHRLDRLPPDARERWRLIECLAWLRYRGVLPELRRLLRSGGLSQTLSRASLADSLVRVGDAGDRADMARLAIEHLERSAAGGYREPRSDRTKDWDSYRRIVGTVAPDEVAEAEAGLSDAARLALTWHPLVFPSPEEADAALAPLVVPRRTMAGFSAVRPEHGSEPAGKFLGLPEWRETPQWPVGGDGQLLMFLGQLPLDDDRTAYLFTAGPDEAEPLGPGSAVVIQPGGGCHLPTVDRREGPRHFDWVADRPRFVRRSRRLPSEPRYIVWSHDLDPIDYRGAGGFTPAQGNKVGGSPAWLQGDDTPGPEWRFAFQFDADRAGSERGDGAIFYGWVNDAGQGALGWQCS